MFIWILLPSYMNSFVHQSPSPIPWLLFEFCHTCQIFLWMSDLRNLKMKVARSFYHMTNLQRAVYATYIDSIPYAIDNKNLPGSIPIYSPYNPLSCQHCPLSLYVGQAKNSCLPRNCTNILRYQQEASHPPCFPKELHKKHLQLPISWILMERGKLQEE